MPRESNMELSNTTNALLTAIEARIKSVVDEVRAMRESLGHDAATMPGVVSHLMIVRDSLEKLIPRLEDLPKEAVAEAIAPGVSVTIERIGFALTKLQREVEEVTGQAQSGIERLTATGVAALAEAKLAADKRSHDVADAQATLRKLIDRLPQAIAAVTPSIARAGSTAVQQVESATRAAVEGLAAATPRSNHRLTAGVAVAGFLAILVAGHWRQATDADSPALMRWAASPAGQSVYAFAKANPKAIGMLEACDLPGWRRSMVNHRAACVVASNRSRQYGWFLPQ